MLGASYPGGSYPGQGVASPTYRFTLTVVVGSTVMPLKPGSLHINDSVGQVQTCDFDIVDVHGVYNPSIHQAIHIDEDMTTIFVGDISDVEVSSYESPYDVDSSGHATGTPIGSRQWHVVGQGYSQWAHRILTGSFSAQAKVPVSLVVQSLASGMGLGSSVSTSPSNMALPDAFLTDNEPVHQALTRLADLATALSGTIHLWRIGTSGQGYGATQLQFFPVTDRTSSYTVGHGGIEPRAGSIRVRVSREQFANTVVLKLDKGLKGSLTETFTVADLFQGTLTLSSACAGAPTITVSGIGSQTVGIKGVDSGKDWYWNAGSSVLTVGDSAVGGSEVITVAYEGLDLRSVTAQDSGSVGTVGVFAVPVGVGDSGNTLSPAAQAAAELGRRNGLATIVRVLVRCPPNVFLPGQLISLNLTGFGTTGSAALTGSYYLRSVRQFDEEALIVWRDLECVSGPMLFKAAQVMSRLAR